MKKVYDDYYEGITIEIELYNGDVYSLTVYDDRW